MPNYHRAKLPGGTYFVTQVTHHRQPCSPATSHALHCVLLSLMYVKNIPSPSTHLCYYPIISIVYGQSKDIFAGEEKVLLIR
ncbi:MAG: hypothetical protein RM368_10815 [Nostoc sp. DedSLP03]|uniref:hypothetical protein n=1 Tax=Nostoc sp. DedSLP03 TaxID=3075400 RepID=UPI002AD59FC7|nr:hypothetical protein [Nostoc sp. DedSLP03]MDZ7965454.1 hypothetical protein [Nostoc sp. DedSLP03]